MSHDLMPLDPSWVSWAERFAWHLDEIPDLISQILKHRDPTKAARFDRERVSGSGADGTPAPVNVVAIDDADEMWTSLMTLAHAADGWFEVHAAWNQKLAEMVRVDPLPEVRSAMRGAIVIGVHPSVDEHGAMWDAYDVAAWLKRHASGIEHRRELAGMADDLERVVRSLRRRYGVDRRRPGAPMRRQCSTCGAVAVIVEWAESVGRYEVQGAARCLECRQAYVEVK